MTFALNRLKSKNKTRNNRWEERDRWENTKKCSIGQHDRLVVSDLQLSNLSSKFIRAAQNQRVLRRVLKDNNTIALQMLGASSPSSKKQHQR